MSHYRTSIRFGAPAEEDSTQFVLDGAFGDEDEAIAATIDACSELASEVGMEFDKSISHKSVSLERSDPQTESRLQIRILEIEPKTLLTQLIGPLDGPSGLHFDRELHRLQKEGGVEKLCVDLSQAHPVGSAGLGVMLNVNDRMDLRLVRVSDMVKKMLSLLGLENVLPRFDSFEDALNAPQQPLS